MRTKLLEKGNKGTPVPQCGPRRRRPERSKAPKSRLNLFPNSRLGQVHRRNMDIEALENLASVTTHLKHLLLIRDLRKIAS